MSATNFLYQFIKNFLVWLLPIVLILFSITSNLPNADLHKQTLKQGDFYSKLSRELKTITDQKADTESKNSLWYIIFGSVIKDLATANWLQEVIEQNIDLTTKWLKGEEEVWTFFMPAQEVNQAVSNQADNQATKLVAENQKNIPVCDEAAAQQIQQEGFNSQKDFCLPQSVKDGQETLTQFINKSGSNVLDGLLQNNPLDNANERFKVETSGLSDGTLSFFKNFRAYFLNLRNTLPFLLAAMVVALVVLLILSSTLNKNMIVELRKILWFVGISTLSTCAVILLILGGTAYLTSWLNDLLVPGFNSPQLFALLGQTFLLFLFNVLSIAIYSGVGMIIVSLILTLVPKIGGKKLSPKKQMSEVDFENPVAKNSFDGQFQANLEAKKVNEDLTASKSSSASFQANFEEQTPQFDFTLRPKRNQSVETFNRPFLADSQEEMPPIIPSQINKTNFEDNQDFFVTPSNSNPSPANFPNNSNVANSPNTPISPGRKVPPNLPSITDNSPTNNSDKKPSWF